MAALKETLKTAYLHLPHVRRNRKRHVLAMRAQYDYTCPTPCIFSENGAGGIMSQNLKLESLSPTAGLWLSAPDLVKLVCNLPHYLALTPQILKASDAPYPVAMLDDITLHLNHFSDAGAAIKTWERKKERVDFDNLFVVTSENGLTKADMGRLLAANLKGLVIFTAKERPDIPHTFCLKQYETQAAVGAYSVTGLDGLRPFEREFNYANWLCGREHLRIGKQ